jgi:putative acetyltransferase
MRFPNFAAQHMSGHYTIEQPGPVDFTELARLWEASVRATHHFLTEENIRFFKPLIREQYLQMVALYCTRNSDGTIAGFIGIADRKVEMLFVAPGMRGKGIGKLLLRFAIDQLHVNAVDVNEQNPQATGFYLHEGFEITGRSETDSLGKPFPLLHLRWPAGASGDGA